MIVLILVFVSLAFSFVPPNDFENGLLFSDKLLLNEIDRTYQPFESLVPHIGDKGINVLSQNLNLHCLIPDEGIIGFNELEIWIEEPDCDTIHLDLSSSLTVDSVTTSFTPTIWFRRTDAVVIQVPDGTPDTVTVRIFYQGNPSAGYFRRQNSHGNDVFYTHAEPINSRQWYPCNDWPWDKFQSRVSIQVPSLYKVLSNGVLNSVDTLGDGDLIWNWQEDNAVATYLVSLAIHPYTVITEDDDFVSYWAYPEDSADVHYDWGRTPEMFDLFVDLFGPYPFDKYATSMYPSSGAMEHQTCTSMGDALVNGERTWEWVVAHELAHHWFGDLVTCHTWMDLWLNEGFATYSEALWVEHLSGDTAYRNYLGYLEARYIGHLAGGHEDRFSIYDPEYMWGVTVYKKAGAVIGMLRDYLGDEVFYEALRLFIDRHSFGTATTAEFIADFEESTGEDLTLFFEQWIYSAGHPVIDCSWHISDGNFYINIEQVQPESTVFVFDLQIQLNTGEDTEIYDFSVSEREQDFVVGCSFTVDDSIEFEIDPDNRVIVEEGVICSVTENMLPEDISLSAYPNPFNSCVNITTDALEIAIINVQGKEVYRGKVENSEFSWNPQELSSGLYIVKTLGEKEKSIRISYIK